MLTRSCFSMLPQRLPPGHSVQSPPRSGYSSAQTSVYPSPLLPHWAAAQTDANLSAHLHRLPTPPSHLRLMRLLPAGVRRCREASSGESCWQGCREASSGRACWQRLPKTRTKKPRKRSWAQKSREQKTVHKENCARRRVCSRRESNPYGHFCPQDFKSCVSTYSTTRAVQI